MQYTFKSTLSSPAQANEILIGADVAASLDNMKIAINASGGTEGTEYSVGTKAHPTVTATTNGATTQVVEARNYGTRPNSFATAETCATGSWTGTTLSGGVENVLDQIKIGSTAADTLDKFKDAINNTAVVGVEGTDYSAGTRAHTQVTATTNTDTAQTVQARNGAFTNASIATSVTGGGNIAAGAATLASGVRGVTAVNTTTYAGSAGISGDVNHV